VHGKPSAGGVPGRSRCRSLSGHLEPRGLGNHCDRGNEIRASDSHLRGKWRATRAHTLRPIGGAKRQGAQVDPGAPFGWLTCARRQITAIGWLKHPTDHMVIANDSGKVALYGSGEFVSIVTLSAGRMDDSDSPVYVTSLCGTTSGVVAGCSNGLFVLLELTPQKSSPPLLNVRCWPRPATGAHSTHSTLNRLFTGGSTTRRDMRSVTCVQTLWTMRSARPQRFAQ
jgi:hypothetical protein